MTVGVWKEKMNRVQIPGLDKAITESKSLYRENHANGSVCGGKGNECVIFPSNICMVAEALERRNNNWYLSLYVLVYLFKCYFCSLHISTLCRCLCAGLFGQKLQII